MPGGRAVPALLCIDRSPLRRQATASYEHRRPESGAVPDPPAVDAARPRCTGARSVRGRVRQRHKCVTRPSVATFAATIAPNVTRGNEQREHAVVPSPQFAVTDVRDVDSGRVTSLPAGTGAGAARAVATGRRGVACHASTDAGTRSYPGASVGTHARTAAALIDGNVTRGAGPSLGCDVRRDCRAQRRTPDIPPRNPGGRSGAPGQSHP